MTIQWQRHTGSAGIRRVLGQHLDDEGIDALATGRRHQGETLMQTLRHPQIQTT